MCYWFVVATLFCVGGAAVDGKIRLRSSLMAPAQHAHFHGARGVVSEVADGVVVPLVRLNTSNFSKAISLLLFGCKKPKLCALLRTYP